MANPKQRYQSPGLGDVLRLQNFILSNSLSAQVATVAKVEIFRINDKMKSSENPRGLVLKETIVNNTGSASPRIFPYPQALNSEYWETKISLDEDEYSISSYVDRWHLILDPAFDIEYPIARKPSTQFNNENSLGWVAPSYAATSESTVTIGTGTKVFTVALGLPYIGGETVRVEVNGNPSAYMDGVVTSYVGSILTVNVTTISGSGPFNNWLISCLTHVTTVDVGANRTIIENGINNNSGSKLTIAEAVAALITKGKNTSNTFEPSPGLMGTVGSIYGSIIINFTGGVGEDHTGGLGGDKVSYFSLTTSDGGATWVGSLESNPGIPSTNHPVSISATFSQITNILLIKVGWSVGYTPSAMKIIPIFVDKWLLEVEYDPIVSNAWDDLIARTKEENKLAVTDHDFKVHPVLWQSSPAPIVSDYDWRVSPTEVYLGTSSWLRVIIEPRVPDNPESVRLHYAYISSGKLRYEMYRIQEDGTKLRLIAQNTINWHAENKGLFRINTTQAPLNRAQDCYIVFFVDLPDGSIIRSPRIVLSVRDDRVSFFRNVQDRTEVF